LKLAEAIQSDDQERITAAKIDKAENSGFLGLFTDDKKVNAELQHAVDIHEDFKKLNTELKDQGGMSGVISKLDEGANQELAKGIEMEASDDPATKRAGLVKAEAARIKQTLGKIMPSGDPLHPLGDKGDPVELVEKLKKLPAAIRDDVMKEFDT